MRFVWAVVAFVLATLLIGAGIAQRTLFVGPSSQDEQLSVEQAEPFILIDGAVLRANPGLQTLIIRGDGDLFAAYGRTSDVQAWLSDAAYNSITLGDDGVPVTTVVDPLVTTETDGEPAAGRNPDGSDLWLDSFVEQDQIISDTQLPEGTSYLIARDGTEPAPDDITISWPLDNSTPWAGPLVAGGILVLLVGVVLYILGIRHQRRGRGPRRKGPGPLPPTEPIDLAIDVAPEREALQGAASGPVAAPASKTKDAGTQRRALRRRLAVPVLALSAVVAMTGCSADSWPQLGSATPSPSPSPTVIAPENQKPPAVTEEQAARILKEASATIAAADEDRDIDLAATRLDGAALAARRTDYTLRKKIKDRDLPAVIPTDKIEILLPQANDGWPRTVLMLAKATGDDSVAPVIMTMTQPDPWTNYKITDMAEMHASVEIPDVAPAWLGTTPIPPDSTFLEVAPNAIAAAFADVVDHGEKSESYGRFDDAALEIVDAIGKSRQAVVDGLKKAKAAKTSKATFSIAPTDEEPVSLATLDSGAIVAVSFVETQKVVPTVKEAAVRFGDNPEVKALTGVKEAAKGVTTTYGLQMFFAVPTQGSSEPIRLLAVHQDILDAKVIKK